MRKLAILAILLPGWALAQTPWAVYGGGGYTLTYMKPDLASINSHVADIGYPELGDQAILSMGGMGYFLVISGKTRLMIGGGGTGGSIREVEGNREVELRENYAYLQIGIPHLFSTKLIGGITATLGAGTAVLDLKEIEDSPSWENEVFTSMIRLRKTFYTTTPSIFLEFHPLAFLGVRVEGGYFLTFGEKFKQEGKDVAGAPEFTGRTFYGGLTIILGGGGTSY
jgi:hypothetical protein